MKPESILDHHVNSLYEKYLEFIKTLEEPDWEVLIDDPNLNCVREFNKEEFKFHILNNRITPMWKKILS